MRYVHIRDTNNGKIQEQHCAAGKGSENTICPIYRLSQSPDSCWHIRKPSRCKWKTKLDVYGTKKSLCVLWCFLQLLQILVDTQNYDIFLFHISRLAE